MSERRGHSPAAQQTTSGSAELPLKHAGHLLMNKAWRRGEERAPQTRRLSFLFLLYSSERRRDVDSPRDLKNGADLSGVLLFLTQ